MKKLCVICGDPIETGRRVYCTSQCAKTGKRKQEATYGASEAGRRSKAKWFRMNRSAWGAEQREKEAYAEANREI